MQLKTHEYPPKIFFKDLEETFKYRANILRGRINKSIFNEKSIVESEKEVIDKIILEQWDKTTQSNLYFDRTQVKDMQDGVSGVYLIYDKRDVLQYIGMSHNLKTRLYSHFSRFDIGSVIVYEMDRSIIALTEMYLIAQLFPYKNIEGKILYDSLSVNHIDDVCRTSFFQNETITLKPIRTTYG